MSDQLKHVEVTRASVLPPARRHGKLRKALPALVVGLGLVLTPAGLIALFCQLLDVSAQSTAAVCLLSVAIMTISMFRRAINNKVPAVLPLGLLCALASIFFFSYKNILLKNTGLIRFYHHSNDYLSELEPAIQRSRREIWFFGTDFYISSGERRMAILDALRRGVHVRYLIYDSASPDLTKLSRDFGQNEAELRGECEKGMASLRELSRAWNNESKNIATPGELEIRVFDVTPRGRLYIFDPGLDSGRTFFVPYVNNVNSAELPGFLLENVEAGVYRAYYAGVTKLWAQSRPITIQ